MLVSELLLSLPFSTAKVKIIFNAENYEKRENQTQSFHPK